MALRFSLTLALAILTVTAARAETWISKGGQDHPLVGRIFDVRSYSETTESILITRARKSTFLLLGEKHDNADHHQLQARFLNRVARDRRPAIVLEMLNPSQVSALRAHRRRLPADVDGLRHILAWDRTGWPPWSIYRPIFAVATKHYLPIHTGNLSRREINQIGRNGYGAVENRVLREHLKSNPPAKATRSAIRTSIIASHCGHASDAIIPGMIAVQRVRDATMAQAMIQAAEDAGQAALVAGTGHTRDDRGVPRFIRSLGSNKTLISIAFLEVRPGLNKPATYASVYGTDRMPFNVVWFTPAVDFTDPCVKFRHALERMNKKKRPPGGVNKM